VAGTLGLEIEANRGSERVGAWIFANASSPGDLFFALRVPSHGRHAYVERSFAKGAAAVVRIATCRPAGVVLKVGVGIPSRHCRPSRRGARRSGGEMWCRVTGKAPGEDTTKPKTMDRNDCWPWGGFPTTKTEGNSNITFRSSPVVACCPPRLDRKPPPRGGHRNRVNHTPGEIRELAAIAGPPGGRR